LVIESICHERYFCTLLLLNIRFLLLKQLLAILEFFLPTPSPVGTI
jgi:hypothetical protein